MLQIWPKADSAPVTTAPRARGWGCCWIPAPLILGLRLGPGMSWAQPGLPLCSPLPSPGRRQRRGEEAGTSQGGAARPASCPSRPLQPEQGHTTGSCLGGGHCLWESGGDKPRRSGLCSRGRAALLAATTPKAEPVAWPCPGCRGRAAPQLVCATLPRSAATPTP